MNSKLKLRHDNIVICPYYDNGRCSHPRCIRMMGLECMKKGVKAYGKIKSRKNINKHSTRDVAR